MGRRQIALLLLSLAAGSVACHRHDASLIVGVEAQPAVVSRIGKVRYVAKIEGKVILDKEIIPKTGTSPFPLEVRVDGTSGEPVDVAVITYAAGPNDTILGDVAEAVMGALYLDGGLGAAYDFLERMLGDKLDMALHQRPDPKTTLQEWAQSQGLEPPDYELVGQVGPQHAPEFTIAVRLGSFDPLTATGSSKKLAEHKAAEAFLVREKVWQGASS